MIDSSLRGPFFGLDLDDINAIIARDGVRALAEKTLDAIERTNATLNAFVHLDRDRTFTEADALDALPESARGPLHGLPIGVKDLIDVAGWPVTSGSNVYAGRIATEDAEVVRRLRAAGALIIGVTLTHEFAYGPTGDVSKDGAAHNPHDPSRMTGGSSAGSGAAVAAGLVPFALGTDTGGSIRVPAALCGCVGLKPAHGEVPVAGVQDLSPTLDHVGVLATTENLAWAAWATLTGRPEPEPIDPEWSWLSIDRVPLVEGRIENAVREVFAAVSDNSSFEVSLGNWPEMRGVAGSVMSREAYDVHAHQLDDRKADYDEQTWERIDSGRHISIEQYNTALGTRDNWRATMSAFLSDNQVLMCPTVGIVAPQIGVRDMTVEGEEGLSTRIVTNLTVRWNLLGYPVISVPLGEFDGLPYAAQLIAKPGAEGALRRAAAEVTRRATP